MARKKIFLLTVMATLSLCSCRKESMSTACPSIKINVAGGPFTKGQTMDINALRTEAHFVMDAFLDDPWKNYSITDFPTNYYNAEGIAINKEQTDDPYAAGIYIDSGASYNVSYSSSAWNINKSYYWVANDLMRFFCYYPKEYSGTGLGTLDITTRGNIKTDMMVFDYELPPHTSDNLDATAQQDILFAYSEKKYINDIVSSDKIDINFNHPLSKVNFCVSPDDGTFDTNLEIKSIAILNVISSGTCTFHGNGSISGKTMFSWAPGTDRDSYCQLYEATFNKAYTANWETGDIYNSDGETPSGRKKRTCNNSFFMIPQDLSGASAIIEVTFSNTGTGADIARQIAVTDLWEPGYYYTYKISATTIGRTIMASISLEDWDNYDDKLLF